MHISPTVRDAINASQTLKTPFELVTVPQSSKEDARPSSAEFPRKSFPWLAARSNESYCDFLAVVGGERHHIKELMARAEKIYIVNRSGNNPILLLNNVATGRREGTILSRMCMTSEVVVSNDIIIEIPLVTLYRYTLLAPLLATVTTQFKILNSFDGVVVIESETIPQDMPVGVLCFPTEFLLSSGRIQFQVTVRTRYGSKASDIVALGLSLQTTLGCYVYKQAGSLRLVLANVVSYDILNQIKKLGGAIVMDVRAEAPIVAAPKDPADPNRRPSTEGATSTTVSDDEELKLFLKKGNAPCFSTSAVTAIASALGAEIIKIYESSALLRFSSAADATRVAGSTINGGLYIVERRNPQAPLRQPA